MNYFHLLTLVTKKRTALSSATHYAMFQKIKSIIVKFSKLMFQKIKSIEFTLGSYTYLLNARYTVKTTAVNVELTQKCNVPQSAHTDR